MIQLRCPCGALYQVPDECAGRVAKCRECGLSLVTPPAGNRVMIGDVTTFAEVSKEMDTEDISGTKSCPPTVGDRLRATRERAGLSQGDLAAGLGLARHTIGNLEAGRSDLSIDLAVRVAGLLGFDPIELLPGPPGRVLRVRVTSYAYPALVEPLTSIDSALWRKLGGAALPMALPFVAGLAGREGVSVLVEPRKGETS